MAADDAGEKTEAPTARRRSEAREQGRIARSSDLTAAIGLLAGLSLLNAFGPGMLDAMLNLTRDAGGDGDISTNGLKISLVRSVHAAIGMTLPFLLLLLVLSVTGNLTQSGAAVTWKKLQPKLGAINPVAGLRRLFTMQNVTRLALSMLKMAFVGGVAYSTIMGELGTVLAAGSVPAAGIVQISTQVIFKLALRMGLMLLVLGVLDYFYQRWSLERSLKMTKQEVKDEMKHMEGDPLLKRRQRQVQARIALQRIGLDVPKADVIVTNPTEYAIAIKYDEQTMAAPRVLAKGKDFLALRIRQVAEQHGIPVLERPPLARALYAQVEVGHEIPPAFYRAVAEVLAYVYQLAGRRTATA